MIFTPSKNNPILKPNKKNSWEAAKVYNPGVVYYNNKYHLFYRAVGFGKNWKSVIGYAVSKDGVKFKRAAKPILLPKGKLEIRGLEDPRITKIGNKFYMAMAAYDGITGRLNIAISKNLVNWKRKGPALKDFLLEKYGGVFVKYRKGERIIKKMPYEWSKSGGIFSEKINGKYWMMFGEFKIWQATSKNGIRWKVIKKPFINSRSKYFDNVYVEMGPPPIKTKNGWLVLYHGINKERSYQLGYLLLDLKNPKKILYRSKNPIFFPLEASRFHGIVDIAPGGLNAQEKMEKKELKKFIDNRSIPKVIFCNGAVLIKDTLRIYYGINDTYIGTATAKLKDILDSK